MQCPRCHGTTQEMSNHDIKIDLCFEGCGGIWFDNHELKKMDEQHESDPAFLQGLAQSQKKTLTKDERIDCPKCDSQPMMRRFWSVKQSVELDECPRCAGIWLDAGELTHIYSLFKTEAERTAAATKMIDDTFGPELAKMKAESEKDLQKARRFAHALRFICPSYYIPGKQDWGAF